MKHNKKPGRVKSALLNWLGVPISLTNGEFWQEWSGVSTSGKLVTADKAMQLSTVWACVRLLSESISTLPIKIYQSRSDGSRTLAKEHPVYRLLCKQPNIEMTPSRFMLMVVASLCLRGNSFIEKKYIGPKLVALVPLLPQNMVVKRDEASGMLEYKYTDPFTKEERIVPIKNMMHIRGFGMDGICGMIPIQTGRNVIGSALSVEESAAKIFENGLQSSGFISSELPLNDEQRERIRSYLLSFVGSKNAGKMMVLEGGMKYNNVTMNPEAAQMLESRAFSIEEICRWFRVPPFMVGHMDKQSSWASSVEGMNMQFLTNTLRPLLVNIEQEISRCLLSGDDDYYAEFSVEGLLRADSAGRAAYYTTSLQNGWMSRNDVRRLENLPPIDGGDIYTVQLNLTPIDQLGKDISGSEAEKLKAQITNWLFPEGDPTTQPQKPHSEE
ncbi:MULTISPECIES: phage portal protein [Providencia]|uniref:Phage portal protein n=1 Tax=Providencia huaxiensis TaxID=2027290 RepID=A0ABU2IYN1_9GAMM|nr:MULTISPECIES: phage portal protein [Providencia]MCX9118801.1 phage portal protein [Providencia rettgeri]MDT0133494.1 phage portal protein [Providencia huaxiensis]MDT1979900.1 phage portal protein [Providencia huaxiensis]RFT10737.1 phage portal protein [Providencia rettgeri]HEM6844215.1 phage portal protein [Providencia rettgeri]